MKKHRKQSFSVIERTNSTHAVMSDCTETRFGNDGAKSVRYRQKCSSGVTGGVGQNCHFGPCLGAIFLENDENVINPCFY